MIVQHRIALDTAGIFVGPALAYPLYAWLLSNVPSEYGDALHEQGTRPISQYVSICLRTRRPRRLVPYLSAHPAPSFIRARLHLASAM